jgi:acyl-CoA reductase-like NAD-dependent aldehyde dehydrogenase
MYPALLPALNGRVSATGVLMIQGFNPRTGEPAGKPVAETTGAEVDAAVQAAAAALPEWAGLGGQERARALEAAADALDARAGGAVFATGRSGRAIETSR